MDDKYALVHMFMGELLGDSRVRACDTSTISLQSRRMNATLGFRHGMTDSMILTGISRQDTAICALLRCNQVNIGAKHTIYRHLQLGIRHSLREKS